MTEKYTDIKNHLVKVAQECDLDCGAILACVSEKGKLEPECLKAVTEIKQNCNKSIESWNNSKFYVPKINRSTYLEARRCAHLWSMHMAFDYRRFKDDKGYYLRLDVCPWESGCDVFDVKYIDGEPHWELSQNGRELDCGLNETLNKDRGTKEAFEILYELFHGKK